MISDRVYSIDALLLLGNKLCVSFVPIIHMSFFSAFVRIALNFKQELRGRQYRTCTGQNNHIIQVKGTVLFKCMQRHSQLSVKWRSRVPGHGACL